MPLLIGNIHCCNLIYFLFFRSSILWPYFLSVLSFQFVSSFLSLLHFSLFSVGLKLRARSTFFSKTKKESWFEGFLVLTRSVKQGASKLGLCLLKRQSEKENSLQKKIEPKQQKDPKNYKKFSNSWESLFFYLSS